MSQEVASQRSSPRPKRVKVKRVWLAILLTGVGACIIVAVIGITSLFLMNILASLVSPGRSLNLLADDLPAPIQGVAIAALAAMMNWVVGYLTIPAAMLALGLSLGRFPRRGIVHTGPYLRWGAIWGGLLVAAPSIFAAIVVSGGAGTGWIGRLLGAALGGASIGALAGLASAGLFLLIVRPAQQVKPVDASVF